MYSLREKMPSSIGGTCVHGLPWRDIALRVLWAFTKNPSFLTDRAKYRLGQFGPVPLPCPPGKLTLCRLSKQLVAFI